MAEVETLRSTILQESDLYGSKKRFGLFSQPISVAIGDNGPYKSKVHPRNSQGKPITLPRNFYVSPNKSGVLKKSYFGPLNTLATSDKKDIFIEEGKRLLKQQYQCFSTGRKEVNFVPIAGIKPISNSSYLYVEQNNPELNPKRNRDPEGKVKSQPRNFYTNLQSKIIDTTFKPYKHLEDPYDREHKMQVEKMKKDKAKEHEASFRPNSFSPQLLHPSKQVYDLAPEIKKEQQKDIKLNIYPHENAWKSSNPMKSGHEGFIESFPKYMENPPQETKRKQAKPKQKEPFKRMSISLTTPSPSVSLNRVNLMKSLNQSLTLRR